MRLVYRYQITCDPSADGPYDVPLCQRCQVDRSGNTPEANYRKLCLEANERCNDCLASSYDDAEDYRGKLVG